MIIQGMKPTLTIIQSTHASLGGLQQSGLLDRHKRLLTEYSRVFHVVLYTCDVVDYSAQLGIEHHPVSWLPERFGWRHLVFYLWLVWQAPHMKGVIKVFGSNIPSLPLVRLLSGKPMMVTYQWDYAEQTRKNERTGLKHWLAPLLERLALCPADLVLVTAGWLEDKVRRCYHKKAVLLPNWVDLGALPQTSVDKIRNGTMILYAGRLHWSKGVNVLLDAFAKVKQQHPGAMLVICGEGEQRRSLEEQAKLLGTNNVEVQGRLSNARVLQLMSTAAIFVLPTLTMEGHPKALIEAMACGCACIASDVPGNRDLISHEQNGMLVPANHVDSLSEAICQLIGDEELRKRLGNQASLDAAKFEFSPIVTQEIHILLSLLTSS